MGCWRRCRTGGRAHRRLGRRADARSRPARVDSRLLVGATVLAMSATASPCSGSAGAFRQRRSAPGTLSCSRHGHRLDVMKSNRPSGLGWGVIRASAGVMALGDGHSVLGCFYRRPPPEYGPTRLPPRPRPRSATLLARARDGACLVRVTGARKAVWCLFGTASRASRSARSRSSVVALIAVPSAVGHHRSRDRTAGSG